MRKLFFSFSLSMIFLSGLGAEEASSYVARDFSSLLDMPGWNRDLLSMHLTLYQGYVKNTNLLLQEITQMDKEGSNRSYAFGALKRRLGWEFDGMKMHELYFENLGGQVAEKGPHESLIKQMEKDFGSFEAWKDDFIATGLIRGIGWVVLYRDPASQKLVNVWVNEHDVGHLVRSNPLLVMDVFEHAYITQFGLDRAKYIDLFFQSLQWKTVNQRWLPAKP